MSNRYKLINWYPSLPDRAKNRETIAEPHTDYDDQYGLLVAGDYYGEIPKDEVKGNSDHWRTAKNYEILKMKAASGTVLTYDGEQCIHRTDGMSLGATFPLQESIQNPKSSIYSVKRLSDGEIFTIGDTVGFSHDEVSKITELEIDKQWEGDLKVRGEGKSNLSAITVVEHKEEPVLDYEIISFVCVNGSGTRCDQGDILITNGNQQIWHVDNNKYAGTFGLTYLLNHRKNFQMYKVKRTSDGTIFQLGDVIDGNTAEKVVIDEMYISDFSDKLMLAGQNRAVQIDNATKINKDYRICNFEEDYKGEATITSVMRLSDGQVFDIGDYITTGAFNDPRPIKEINITSGGVNLKQISEIMDYGGSTCLDRAQLLKDNSFKVLKTQYDRPLGKILKIKRKSDGEIFEVGDKLSTGLDGYCSIYGFYIQDGRLHIRSTHTYLLEKRNKNVLEQIEHKKESVFTADDGKDLYKRDKYWYFHVDELKIKKGIVSGGSGTFDDIRYYGTKEAAEKAVKELKKNVPKYSEKDIEEAYQELNPICKFGDPFGYTNFHTLMKELKENE